MQEGYGKENKELKAALDLCRMVGKLLLENGAETALIRELVERTGKLMGMDSTDISISASSMVISVSKGEDWYTRASRCPERGVNMAVIMEVQQILVRHERGEGTKDDISEAIMSISDKRYNRWVVAVVVAFSCGFFSKLGGADWFMFSVVSFAAFVGTVTLQQLKHRAFTHLTACFISAFITTLVTGVAVRYGAIDTESSGLVMLSAVLMLVPGVPLVNGVSDVIKGFKNMGLARWTFASLLTLATAIGMILSMNFLGL
jgi:uncharacterized membrane protein YjjP (DUF1212 family)